MNILVTGANGQLGHEMQICAKNSNHKFVFTDVAEGYEKLDITNLDAIREKVKENDIQVIVNCAAYTNVDKAESDFDLANLLNNTAAGNLAQAMKEVDGTLIHVSTDYVCSRATRTSLARKTGTPIRSVYTARPSSQEKRASRLQAASTSSSAQHGSTRSGVRTS